MKPAVHTYFDHASNTATHLVVDPETGAAAIVDPVLDFDPASGRLGTGSADTILADIAARGLGLRYVLETHAHADHLSAADHIRQMTDAQAAETYQWAVERYGHTEKSVQYIFEFRDLSRRDQMPYRGKHNDDPEFQRALKYLQIYDQKMAEPLDPNRPLSVAEQATFDKLKAFDAFALLQDRAFQLDGKITPTTMIHAYGDLREGLLKQLRADPDNPLYPAEITKLQQVLILGVARTDYVQANLARGVDIVAKEPVLVSFRGPKTASAAPLKRVP